MLYDIRDRMMNIRKQLCITQQELADILGVTNVTICRWEIGQHKPRSKYLMKRLKAVEESFKIKPLEE